MRLVQHERPDAAGGQFQPPSTISEGIMPVHDSLIAGKMVKMAATPLPSQGPQSSTETTTAAYALHFSIHPIIPLTLSQVQIPNKDDPVRLGPWRPGSSAVACWDCAFIGRALKYLGQGLGALMCHAGV